MIFPLKNIQKEDKYKVEKDEMLSIFDENKGTIGIIADNLLKRDFKANKPNEKWVTDVTEFKVNNDKLYLSPIVDLFNGEIVSFNL